MKSSLRRAPLSLAGASYGCGGDGSVAIMLATAVFNAACRPRSSDISLSRDTCVYTQHRTAQYTAQHTQGKGVSDVERKKRAMEMEMGMGREGPARTPASKRATTARAASGATEP